MLMAALPGSPGEDYPVLDTIPVTEFSCRGRVFGGHYADPGARCQLFHVCGRRGQKFSFLCPAGTIFNQNFLTCDFWYNFDCSRAESLYGVNRRNQVSIVFRCYQTFPSKIFRQNEKIMREDTLEARICKAMVSHSSGEVTFLYIEDWLELPLWLSQDTDPGVETCMVGAGRPKR